MKLKQRISLALVISLFLSGSALSAAKDIKTEEKNNFILILSSYDYGHEWGTAVAKSIRTELEKSNNDLLVNISYADVANRKSFLGGRLGMQSAFTNGRLSLTHYLPGILVIIGDEAWMYYRIMNLRGFWEDIPVVLVGVHPEILSDYSAFFSEEVVLSDSLIPLDKTFKSFNIRALLNNENIPQTVELIKTLMPERKKCFFVSRNNYQDRMFVLRFENYINSQYPGLDIEVISYNNKETDPVIKTLKDLPEDAVLITNSGLPGEVSIPVFAVNETILEGKNIIGGYYSSTLDYGRQAAGMVLDIYENGAVVPNHQVVEPDNTFPYLNKEALDFWQASRNASSIEEAVYENIPPSFFEINKRLLLTTALPILVFIVIIVLMVRISVYRKYLQTSLDDYKKLYEEYLVIYENMPMGLVQFDIAGNVLKHNPVAGDIIELFTKQDIKGFNIYNSDIFGHKLSDKIRIKENIDDSFTCGDRIFQIAVKYIRKGLAEKDTVLMILIDITEIQQEKKSKEEVYSVFSFAMNLASLGLAEYNLLDGSGFATEAWYSNFGIDRNTNFFHVYQHVVNEDIAGITDLMQDIKNGERESFMNNIRVNVKGKLHWLNYVVQLIEFAPAKGRIIVAALALNIDKQKYHETELARAIALISESDKMKNAFIANMSSEIRPSLDELVRASTELTQCNDKSRKEELMQCIEKNNEVLLEYIQKIIDLSHSGENSLNL